MTLQFLIPDVGCEMVRSQAFRPRLEPSVLTVYQYYKAQKSTACEDDVSNACFLCASSLGDVQVCSLCSLAAHAGCFEGLTAELELDEAAMATFDLGARAIQSLPVQPDRLWCSLCQTVFHFGV